MLWKVIIAIFLAVITGTIVGKTTTIFGIPYYEIFGLLGQLFLNSLTLLVVPLVASAIISGLGTVGEGRSLRRLGIKTFGFYILTIFLAILVGIVVVNVIKPGLFYRDVVTTLFADTVDLTLKGAVPTNHWEAISQILLKLIPSNLIEAAGKGNMLGVIFFSLLFGFALLKMNNDATRTLANFWRGLLQCLMQMTNFLMKAMPIGVFFLVAKVIATQGVHQIGALAYFFGTVLIGLICFCFVVLPLLLKCNGINPINHIRAIAPALVTAFSTSSSAATLPVTLECMEKRAGLSNRVCSFVIPLGTSMNMAGSALYECVAALFIAQVYGIDMTWTHQIIVVVLSLITSMGVAAVPSASVVALIIILNAMGLPAEGIALILPVDRLLDMCRTTANVLSDSSCAALVARSEGEVILHQTSSTKLSFVDD
jgi:Na+/H+-dicarboxylate symporter